MTTTTEPETHGGVSNYNLDRVEWRAFGGGDWAGRMSGIFGLYASPYAGHAGRFIWSTWVHGTCMGRGETDSLSSCKLYAELCADRRESEIWHAIKPLDVRPDRFTGVLAASVDQDSHGGENANGSCEHGELEPSRCPICRCR